MTTFDPSRLTDCAQTEFPLMSSQAASPARTSASQDVVQASTESAADCGPSSPGSLARYDPDTSSWRTSQRCFLEGWQRFSETWPRSGMMRSGIAYPLRPLAPRTYGTGFGSSPTHSVPTPTTQDHIERACTSVQSPLNFETNKSVSLDRWVAMWPTPTINGNYNRKGASATSGDGLATAVQMWPTPQARDWKGAPASLDTLPLNSRPLNEAVRFRTPQARDGDERGPSDPQRREEQGHSVSLHDQIGGSLNPDWVELLMGLPKGWTDLGPPAGKTERRE